MPLKQKNSLADTSEEDVDVITAQNEQVVISRRSFTADGLATFLTKKQLHLYEDRNDIIERFKGKTIYATEYRGTTPDALIASIQQRNCEYVILEVPHDTSLALYGDFYTECEHYAVPYYYGFEGTSLKFIIRERKENE